MPIVCVDVVILHQDKVLLCLRTSEPAKGLYWLPGGRVNKGESLLEAAKRKVLQETGLKVNKLTELGVDTTIFKTGPFGWATHTVNVVFFTEVKSTKSLKMDSQSSELNWFDINKPIKKSHPYVKKFINLAKQQYGKNI